jgi:hypothetical protein
MDDGETQVTDASEAAALRRRARGIALGALLAAGAAAAALLAA